MSRAACPLHALCTARRDPRRTLLAATRRLGIFVSPMQIFAYSIKYLKILSLSRGVLAPLASLCYTLCGILAQLHSYLAERMRAYALSRKPGWNPGVATSDGCLEASLYPSRACPGGPTTGVTCRDRAFCGGHVCRTQRSHAPASGLRPHAGARRR